MDSPFLSLVIPAYNEQENVEVLLQRVAAALAPIGKPFEVIIVDDGSSDGTPKLLADGMQKYPWLRVVRMHKGHVKARVVITGKSAHSGYPHLGVNAIELAARAVTALGALRMELEREEAPNRQHFGDVPFVPLNIGTIRGGSAINVVPDRCVIELGLRPMPGSDVSDLVARVENAVRRAVNDAPADVKVLSNSPPLLLDENAFVHRELCSLVGQSDTQSVNFATDAGWFQELDVDCVLFGPGSIEDAHRPNEFMPKAEFERAAEILDRTIESFCVEAPARG